MSCSHVDIGAMVVFDFSEKYKLFHGVTWAMVSGFWLEGFWHWEALGRCSGSQYWILGERGQVSDHVEAFDRKDEEAVQIFLPGFGCIPGLS